MLNLQMLSLKYNVFTFPGKIVLSSKVVCTKMKCLPQVVYWCNVSTWIVSRFETNEIWEWQRERDGKIGEMKNDFCAKKTIFLSYYFIFCILKILIFERNVHSKTVLDENIFNWNVLFCVKMWINIFPNKKSSFKLHRQLLMLMFW